MPVTFTTAIDRDPVLTSYAQSMGSEVTTLISVSVDIDSHSTSISAAAERSTVTLYRKPESFTAAAGAEASRSQANYGDRIPESHSAPIVTFTTNERTSLELIDYTVDYDDGHSVWYTPWIQETKVLGREDRFVVRADVVENAKEPSAKIVIQYDGDGNGSVDEESEPINVGKKERLHEVTDIPVNETGHYRMKIDEYSGYNSLTSLDMGIVN